MKTLIFTTLMMLPCLGFGYTAEQILGYTYDADGIAFQVSTGGCTSRESFVVKQQVVDRYKTLVLYRSAPDVCLAYYPFGIQIFFSYDELEIQDGEKFKVQNSIGMSRRGPF